MTKFKQQALKRAAAFDITRVLPEYLRIYERGPSPAILLTDGNPTGKGQRHHR